MQCYQLTFAILFIGHMLPEGESAVSKQGLMQMQGMMRNLCKSRTGVKTELMTKAKEEGIFDEDEKFKCYLKCCLGMMQTMKNNKINVESATKQAEKVLPDELRVPSMKSLNACKDSGGSDPCDIAYNFAVCSYKFDKDHFLIPL